MKKPNFFIIGAPKCGTTSLAAWLAEHPNIYMSPIKEPHFFCKDFNMSVVPNMKEYERLFKKADPARHIAVGEASTSYLLSQIAVPTIEQVYPNAKYIVMLRNPADMAYSLHNEWLFWKYEHIADFETAWRLSPYRRQGMKVTRLCREPKLLDYQSVCRLGDHLERLLNLVPRERVHVVVLDDLINDARGQYLEVLRFLGVPDDGRLEFPAKNPAKVRRWPTLYTITRVVGEISRFTKHILGIPTNRGTGILRLLDRFNIRVRPRPPMSETIRKELIQFFEEDIKKLEHLLGRDLSQWYYSNTLGK